MKNQLFATLGFVALLSAGQTFAQNRQSATVPFGFQAGGAHHSEGDYLVERLTSSAIKVTNQSSQHSMIMSAPIASGSAFGQKAALVFEGNRDAMRLTEVRFPGYPAMRTMDAGKSSSKVAVDLR